MAPHDIALFLPFVLSLTLSETRVKTFYTQCVVSSVLARIFPRRISADLTGYAITLTMINTGGKVVQILAGSIQHALSFS